MINPLGSTYFTSEINNSRADVLIKLKFKKHIELADIQQKVQRHIST